MIYISSSCVEAENIIDAIDILSKSGIKNIELSGGTKYLDNLEEKLLEIVKKNKLTVRIHNYFPPPEKDFVINIASQNKLVLESSLKHCLNSIQLSKKLGAKEYSVHAGFLLDPGIKEIGLKNDLKVNTKLYDQTSSEQTMFRSLRILEKEAGRNFKIYLENNVLSYSNYKKYKNNPFLLTTKEDYLNLKKKVNINFLLDVAHLRVSCNSLGKNYKKELDFLFDQSDYIHLSGNNSLEDSNESIKRDKEVLKILKTKKIKNKSFTIEVYRNLEEVLDEYTYLNKLIYS